MRPYDWGEDMNSIRGWFNKGDWGREGFLTAVLRLTYSLSEWVAYGRGLHSSMIQLNLSRFGHCQIDANQRNPQKWLTLS